MQGTCGGCAAALWEAPEKFTEKGFILGVDIWVCGGCAGDAWGMCGGCAGDAR